jgi:ribosome-binding factor A
MDSTRQQKYARLIQKELGAIFQHDTKSMFGNTFITVTNVKVSPDMGLAKAYLSFMLVNDKLEAIEKVKQQTKAIRKLLSDRIGKQTRVIPELVFYLDDNVDYAAKMEEIFSKIVIPPDTESPSES